MSRRRRIGCTTVIVLWFMLLLTPCLCFYISVQQEVTIALGAAPGQSLRVWLVMEPRTRGLGVSVGQVSSETATEVCVETLTRYLLWQGRPQDTLYCECYAREDPAQPWQYQGSEQGVCVTGS
ncbi:MAG TPA: hypothetical protein VER79_05685 [Candidatus Limnocylindrales bacterium]|nr:hypothetical protein [Candidatus Limnocylindrales bacterium]